jgi:flagellin-like hook-associated protein FlgL
MAINSVSYGPTYLNQSLLNLHDQLTALQTQLATGKKSTSYAGMGVNEGFAIAARSQLANISAFSDRMTNINTNIGVANTALQSMVDLGKTVQNSANSSSQTLNSAGQTIAQQTATSQLSSMLGILNMQAGDRYLFSGSAINTASVASVDNILNGTTTQAGLKQVISERQQADGTSGLGRLVLTSPTTTSVQVAEDVAGSPFGLKLSAVSSSLTGATVTGPAGSPAAVSIDLGGTNPNNGDKVSFAFKLPDGTTESIQLTASSATPPPAGSFAIGGTPTLTAGNLKAALNTAITTLAGTSLVAASAVAAGNDFFSSAGTATGSVVNNQAAVPAPITGATLLSGAAGTDSLATSFVAGNTITVNNTPITFVASGATGNNQINVNDSVQTLLTKIDSITGTSTPSTVHGGVITLHTDNAASLNVSSTNPAAFAALGFGASATATQPPLRVSGSPLSSATSQVSGTAANTISWYTGEAGPGSARATATARVDQSVTVQYGARASEPAIRAQLQTLAVFAAVTTSASNPNAAAQVAALSQRVTQNLSPQPGQQTIQNIQSDFATAQMTMKNAASRQTQAQGMLQAIVDQAESVSPDQVASQILALQTSLQASYQTTAMLSQLTLTKFLPVA